jgi:serine/threonine protein kinase
MELEVAVKTIQVPEGRKEIVYQDLITWRRLHHENIARILGVTSGFGYPAKSISLVSNWFANGTLTIFLASRYDTFNHRQQLELLQGIAAGVLYLHTSGVVHGNLSGNNVLIDSWGKACLTDFGLSTICGGLAQSAVYIGSPGAIRWAAPELIIGTGQHSTFESDIYSFGSIMLQVFSGKLPWSEVAAEHLIIKKLTDRQIPRRPSNISQIHWDFIRSCWSPSPFNSTHPSSRPSASRINDFLKNTETPVRRNPNSTLCHTVGSIIRRIATSLALCHPKEPRSDRAPRLLNDAGINDAAIRGNTGPSITRDALILNEYTISNAPVYDDTRNKNFDVENSNKRPIILRNTHTDQLSSANSANTSTHPNLAKKAQTQAFEGDLVNQIIRLHDFAVSSGGFRDIWHCDYRRTSSGKVQVAVQVIHLDPAQPELRAKLLRRHQTWLKLEQRNLVRFFGLTSGFSVFPALVTAWMSNGTLTEYLEIKYPFLSTLLKFSLANDIINGLCYVHSQDIVHGHLTGFNVLIDESGRACLANYDLADLLVAHYSVVQEPRWTDPELICGDKSHLPTVSADVYAFGCIMLQILVGRLPYWWIRNSRVVLAKYNNQLPMQDDPDVPKLEEYHKEFLKRCWAPAHSRASSTEVAEFVTAQLHALDES